MIQAIRGTKDIFPDTIYQWQYIEEKFREVSDLFGYKELRTPIFEKTEVFSRSIGEETDIVNKEMYTFSDRGGESVTLRPEQTAALVRSLIQSNFHNNRSASRLWYFGPFFRYERPQKGRLRQFHQYGAECISSPYPEADYEILALASNLIKKLGIEEYDLLLNSLGNEDSRKNYRETLIEYLKDHKESLSEDSQNRLEKNPLRVLDSKAESDINIVKNAPIILDSLDSESKDHFEAVKSLLDSTGLKYKIEPTLVRGLDYYSHTVFEFRSGSLGAQNSFGGGGRYDALFQQLGGKQTPAVGFAMGVERLLIVLEEMKKLPPQPADADVFVIVTDTKFINFANKIAAKVRASNKSCIIELQRRSMKAQMKEANKVNSNYTIIIGEDEVNNNSISLKNMETGEQKGFEISELSKISFD